MWCARLADLSRGGWRLARVLVLLLGISVPAIASADTVYLKNGRVIRAARVTVTEDKVILEQAGNRIELPRSLVERIEEDTTTSEVLEPREESPAEEPQEPSEEGETGETDSEEGDAEGEEAEEPDPEQTREYWQEQMRSLEQEREELRERLEELEREERAFLFSHRSTADVKRQIEEAESELAALDDKEQELRREARRLQIPPGWLRIRG